MQLVGCLSRLPLPASAEDVGRDLLEGEVVTLSLKHVNDLIEAHVCPFKCKLESFRAF
jgi:hypothetical protein